MRFSLATIAFGRESAQMSQILSSQGKNAPSDPYPHYLVRLATSREGLFRRTTLVLTLYCSAWDHCTSVIFVRVRRGVPWGLPGTSGKSHPWTNTSVGETLEELSGPLVHTNLPRKRYGPMIGPYEFPPKSVWTNGGQSSLKVSVLTGIGP